MLIHILPQQHNYSYNELYDLINEKYQIKMGQVAPGEQQLLQNHLQGGSTTKPSTNDKLTVAANSGMAQIKPTNNGLYTTVYDKKATLLTKFKSIVCNQNSFSR